MQGRRTQFAFTLVELLVVIGIIAVLIAILLPTLAAARQSAQTTACASNLRQWAAAMQLYVIQEHGWLPRRGQGAQATTVINRPSDWFNALPVILQMPQYMDLVAANRIPRPCQGTLWNCPAAEDKQQQYFFSYAMNMRLSTWNQLLPDNIAKLGPADTEVFMTEGPGDYCSVLPANANYSPVARHRGRLNISFTDGHVAAFTANEIGCGVGDPNRQDVRWLVPFSTWAGPGGGGGGGN